MNLTITSVDATTNAWLDRLLALRAMTPPQARCYAHTHRGEPNRYKITDEYHNHPATTPTPGATRGSKRPPAAPYRAVKKSASVSGSNGKA